MLRTRDLPHGGSNDVARALPGRGSIPIWWWIIVPVFPPMLILIGARRLGVFQGR